MEKMNLSKKEMQEIKGHYGVIASQLIELMKLSKYEFVNKEKVPGLCSPCISLSKMSFLNFDKRA